MLTWHLWQALRNPPGDNPLFLYITRSRRTAPQGGQKVKTIAIYLLVCVGIALLWPLAIANVAVTAVLVVVTANTIYGMVWAINISAAIAREYEMATHELLCVLPPGRPGANWVLSTAEFYRSPLFQPVSVIIHTLALGLIGAQLAIALCMPLMVIFLPGNPEDTIANLLLVLVYGLTLVIGLYSDHIQSVVLSHLIGMWIPTVTQSRLNAQLWAGGIFLLSQALTFLTIFVLTFAIFDRPFDPSHDSILALALPVLRLGVFYLTRELVIGVLWNWLTSILGTKPDELQQMIRLP